MITIFEAQSYIINIIIAVDWMIKVDDKQNLTTPPPQVPNVPALPPRRELASSL